MKARKAIWLLAVFLFTVNCLCANARVVGSSTESEPDWGVFTIRAAGNFTSLNNIKRGTYL